METDQRREQFVQAALELFCEKGIPQTTIGDISDRVGVARSLFYHYFPNKRAIIDAVVDNRVDDFVEQFDRWNQDYDTRHTKKSLEDIVALLRTYLSDPNSFSSIVMRDHDMVLAHQFSLKGAHKLSRRFAHRRAHTTPEDGLSQARHLKESFYTLAVGLISLMTQHPEIPDQTFVEVIADTMHIPLR